MINTPTVLVLGAGASQSYGFPSGVGLCEDIINYKPEHKVTYPSIFLDGYKDLKRALRLSAVNSIDSFLETRHNFMDIGRLMIALVLFKKENFEALFQNNNNENLYKYIFNEMKCPTIDDFKENKLSFITYNYDRSLEVFLLNALKNAYGIDDIKLTEAFNSIKIIHIHGSLGPPPIIDHSAIEYSSHINHYKDKIEDLSKSIKIIHADEFLNQYEDAYTLLNEAKRVCFLGFGYHKINMDRLFKPHWDRNNKEIICGTALGKTRAEMLEVIHNRNEGNLPLLFDNQNYQCVQFLRETGILFAANPRVMSYHGKK